MVAEENVHYRGTEDIIKSGAGFVALANSDSDICFRLWLQDSVVVLAHTGQ